MWICHPYHSDRSGHPAFVSIALVLSVLVLLNSSRTCFVVCSCVAT